MITFELSDDNLFLNKELLKLSLLIGRDNFLFAFTGLSNGKIKSVVEYSLIDRDHKSNLESELIQTLINNIQDKSLVQKVIAGFVTPEYSIIPATIENKIDLKIALSPVSVKQYLDDFTIVKSEVKSLDSLTLFPVRNEILTFLNANFRSVTPVHGNDYLICFVPDYIIEKSFVFCNFTTDGIQLLTFVEGKLRTSNVIFNSSMDEMLYNIISAYYRNGLPINSIPLYLSGRVQKESLICKTLLDHIKRVEFVNFDISQHYSMKFNQMPGHYFFDVALLSSCV
ncbi:MAG: DUF3822 family protein [Deltaproteobacteria bacterium]